MIVFHVIVFNVIVFRFMVFYMMEVTKVSSHGTSRNDNVLSVHVPGNWVSHDSI